MFDFKWTTLIFYKIVYIKKEIFSNIYILKTDLLIIIIIYLKNKYII